ncbi:putative repeat protein (TIGR01451 family) [Oxalobacteraceae bacterium GrIS 1.11]
MFVPLQSKRLPLMITMQIQTFRAKFSSLILKHGGRPRARAMFPTLMSALALALGMTVAGGAGAAVIDLSVSSYVQTPDPMARGAVAAFAVTVTNNDSSVAATAAIALTVELPSNVDFSASLAPAGCLYDLAASPKTLTCARTGLAATATWNLAFGGVGQTATAAPTRASVSFSGAGDSDANAANNVLVKNFTVINGADLSVLLSGSSGMSGCPGACSAPAGATVGFTIDVSNAGPDVAAQFRVTQDLPSGIDFSFASASGSGWTCNRVATVVSCNYSGAAIASGAHAPPITLSGQIIKNVAGTITQGASVASTDGQTGDPNENNNGPSQVVVSVLPGTSLVAHETLVSNSTGLTTFSPGEALTLDLWASNTGTQDASGVTLRDTLPAGLLIGALPAGCSAAASTITCAPGPLASGATSAHYLIPLTVAAGAVSNTNIVDVARVAPVGGTNTPATLDYIVSAPFAHLTLSKSKSPAVAAAGADITSTITVTNSLSSTSAASGTVRVTDALSANETYVRVLANGWTCAAAGAPQVVTCAFTVAGNLARGAALPNLVLTTHSGIAFVGALSNHACTGLTAGSPHTPPDNSGTGNCADASVTVAVKHIDLAIVKTVSSATLAAAANSFSYTLLVSNNGPDLAPNVTVRDTLPGWYAGSAGTTSGSAVISGAGPGELCTFNQTVFCVMSNLASGASRSITITINRPVADGVLNNTATVYSTDAIDDFLPNNSSSVAINVNPVADVTVSSIAAAPAPVRVGVELTYTTSIKNNGPSAAAAVVVRQAIDGSRMSYVNGSASIAGSAANCVWVAAFGPGALAGQSGIECSGFALGDGEARQLVFKVVPVFPYPDALPANFTSTATISTSTAESDPANDSTSKTVQVLDKQIDLSVTAGDAGNDPSSFGDALVYQVKAQNNGPSRATTLKLTVVPVAPAQGSAAAPYTMLWNSGGSSLPAGASCAQPGGAGSAVICYLAATPSASILASGSSATFGLKFDTGPLSNAPTGSLTYDINAAVESSETGAAPFAGDTLAANNAVSENTTVLPKTDLMVVSKTVSAGSPFSINQPFTYTVVVANLGPALASSVVVTDVLPAGLVMNGAPSATLGSGAALSINNCSASGTPVTVTCTLGILPIAANGADSAKLVSITIPVKAPYPGFAGPFGSDINNTAQIAPSPNTSRDPVPGNNTASVPVQIVKSSIAGSVYNDANRNDVIDGGEKISSAVSFSLYGKDFWNNDIGTPGAPVAVLSANGDFLFDKLPRAGVAGYTIVETQPAGYADRFEVAGSAGGSVPPAVCDGALNCSASAAHNSIAQIVLPANTAATGYLFQEYANATVTGFVYADANNNGMRDGGETGIAGIQVKIAGTTFAGADVCVVLGGACTATTDANGNYSFTVPASQAGGAYRVSEQSLPAGYLDGKDQNGAGALNVIAASAGRAAPESIVLGQVDPGQTYSERNFGELPAASIGGTVYMDSNRDAVRQAGETAGVAGVTVTLAGLDQLGNPVCPSVGVPTCAILTDANGNYSFAGLPPSGAGGYGVTVTPPASLVHVGAQAGSLGGSINGIARGAAVGVVGAGFKSINGIALNAGNLATGYNFGQAPGASGGTAQSLSGYVYVDANRNGRKDGGEAGIAGVAVTLSGTTFDGFNVCTVIAPASCTVSSGADGLYQFNALPESNGAGYTLVETQPAAYLDGAESLGSVSGGANGVVSGVAPQFDQFSGIVLPHGGSGRDYNFGELSASIAGTVYLDLDASGTYSAGDTPLAGVTVALSGAATASAVTDAAGNYRFDGLLAGTYVLNETQPANYAQAGQSAGSGGGNASVVDRISAIVVARGIALTGYNFGEKAGALSGSVYLDSNDNGVREPSESTGIAGVTLTLSGTAADGVTLVNRSALTAADGSYSFTGLPSANSTGYRLTQTQPAAYLDGRQRKGLVNGVTCADPACVIAVANQIDKIAFDASKTYSLFDFGELLGASVSGRVYADANDNAVYDSGEALPNVSLTLSGVDSRGRPINVSVVTGADGTYTFTGLYPSGPGGYTVTETQPVGLGNYPAASGSMVGSAGGVAAPDAITAIVLAQRAAGSGYDFRDKASAISGFVYRDANDNGQMDGGETGIAGVQVTLTGPAGLSRSATSAADGSYHFDGLAGGVYALEESHPALYLDGRETAGSAGGTVDNSSFGTTAQQNSITAITLPVATRATGYLFGERNTLGNISGHVYVDSNRDGAMNAGESGIAGVTVILSGKSADGSVLKLSTQSAADGGFAFPAVPVSDATGYTLTQIQPSGYSDGKTTVLAGSHGTPVSAKPVGVGNIDAIGGVTLAAGEQLNGYLFGENLVPFLKPPVISGYVWFDRNGSRVRPIDGSQAGVAGWTAQLHQRGQLICTATTDASGFYQFDNLHCPGYEASGLPIGSGYSITFLKDGNTMPNVPISTGNKGVVAPGGNRISEISLGAAEAVTEQNLPLDPAGVVYDSVTRKPVPGASVTISGPAGFDAASHLMGGSAAVTQVVGSDGMYQFLLQNAFPSGVYTLSVVAPANYLLAPSLSLPACKGPLMVGIVPDPAMVQASEGAPALSVKQQLNPDTCIGLVAGGAASTQYYTSFTITRGASAPIVNNHLPLDPVGSNALMVSKTTPMVNVTRGDLVPYTITASNGQGAALGAVEVRDWIPAGFKYRVGSARRNGVPAEPVQDGRQLTWKESGFLAKEKKTYSLVLMVGSGVGDGEYTNQAWASGGGARISNLATATVRLVPDATFDCPDIIGKVFDDKNANGYQDQGEAGIAGVRLASARGLLVTTDAEGRFHVACPDIPNADRGSNFVMKLDERTLPSGYRVTTENPRDVRLTRGKVVKLNFGATVHRVVRVELSDAAFGAGTVDLLPQWQERIAPMLAALRERPSVLRIAYLAGAEPAELAQRRIAALERAVRQSWQALEHAYPLAIEVEASK